MPYVKPIQLLRLQVAAEDAMQNGMRPEGVIGGSVAGEISMCPVCGESDCKEKVVKIQEYLFHKSDVDNAEIVQKPE